MATSSAKKTVASASSKLTVMPLFMDQHGVVDEDGETVTCYAEHCGNILLSDQPLPGSKKPRTLVSYQDFWKAGWETDEDGDPVDPADVDKDEVEKFVIDPFTTTKQDLEEQFGKRYLFAIATWGDDAPEGKSGMMKGTGYSFFTGGDVLKKRGLVVEEAPKKKKPAATSAENGAASEDDEPETPEETIERLDEEATERDAKIEALEKKLNERVAPPPAPAPSMASQVKETVEVMNAFGHGPQSQAGTASANRDQSWLDQIAAIRRDHATELTTLRGELTGIATAASIRYESMLKDLRDDNRTAVNALNAQLLSVTTALNEQISTRDKAHVQALSEERSARVEEIKRRDAASDAALNTVKTLLAAAEVRLSDLRHSTDTKISNLTGEGSAHLIGGIKSDMYLGIEKEKAAALAIRATAAETELTKVKGLLEEQRETTHEMKRALAERATGTVGNIAENSGFHIPPVVMKALIPIGSAIIGLVVMYFVKKSAEMPPEVQEFIKNWKKATEGKMSPEDWADQQARARQAKESAADEATRAEEERQTRQRSADYEEEQRQQRARDTESARVAEERRRDDALKVERAEAERNRVKRESMDGAPAAVASAADWTPPYGGNAEAVAASGPAPAVASTPEVMSTVAPGTNNGAPSA